MSREKPLFIVKTVDKTYVVLQYDITTRAIDIEVIERGLPSRAAMFYEEAFVITEMALHYLLRVDRRRG